MPHCQNGLFNVQLLARIVPLVLLVIADGSDLAAQPAAQPVQVAQFMARSPGQEQLTNVFLPAPRELKLLVSQARRALDEDRYNDAVAALGMLLQGLDADREGDRDYAGDYFVVVPGQAGTHVSLRAEALRLLGSMPAKGLEWYQLQYGAQAQLLLDQSLQAGDLEKLTEVTRRFFHTRAGYDATMLLGRFHLDQGRPLAAALCLKRIVDTPPAAALYDPDLSLMLATSWLSAGEREKASQTLLALKASHPQAKFRIGGVEKELFGQDVEPLDWLNQHVAPPTQAVASNAQQWIMFRGDARRNARVSGSAPLTNFRWFVRLALSSGDEKGVEEVQREYVEQHLPALPAMHPLVVENTVLMRTPWHLFAVDFETGKLVWHYPWDDDFDKQFLDGQGGVAGAVGGPRMQFIQQRIWSDSPYGQISSDGRRVFLIDDLGFASAGPYYRTIVQPGGLRTQNPGWPKKYNRLCALSLAEQGKLRWIVGDESGEEEPRLAGAFFQGPPLVLLRQLYVLAEINGEIQLAVLDPDSGQLSWSQQLAHVDNATIDRDPVRRLAGATPSFADGVMVCPTSAGAIVAVDLSTRSLLWGYQYQQSRGKTRVGVFPSQHSRTQSQPGSRWADATVTIADGRVLATPVESSDLHCLDLLTGKLEWKMPRGDFLFVASIDEGKVLLVGKDRVQAIQLSDGQSAWEAQVLPSGGMPSGRGFTSEQYYYLPTTAEELVRIDIRTGELSKPMETRGILGNLVCHQDVVISQGVNLLTSFHQLNPLRGQVAERLKANPEDDWALARQAELYLYDNRRAEALDQLRKAYAIKPRDETRTLMVETMLSLLRDDFAAHRGLAAEAERLISRPEQQEEYLRLIADGLQKTGQRMEAFDAYLRIAGLQQGATPGVRAAGANELQEVADHQFVRRDRWVRTRLAALLSAATPEQLRVMQSAIDRQLQAATDAEGVGALRQFIRHFADQSAADSARLELALRLLPQQRLLEAEILLARVQQSADPVMAGRAMALTAELLTQSQNYNDAAVYYRRLADQWADVEVRGGLTGRELRASLDEDSPVGRVLSTPTQWPRGKVAATPSGEDTLGLASHSRLYRLNILSEQHVALPGMRAALDPARARISVSDGMGRDVVEVPLPRRSGTSFYSSNYGLTRGRFYGHLLVLSMGYEAVAVDTLRASRNSENRQIWLQPLSQSAPGAGAVRNYVRPIAVNNPWCGPQYVPRDQQGNPVGMLGPLTDQGLTFMKGRSLMCVDPLSGEEIWKRTDCVGGSELFGDEQLIVVIPPNATQAQLFRASDGERLRTAKVPPADRRWTTFGRRILTWDDAPGKMILRLYDPLEESDVWAADFPSGSKGWIVDQKEVAVMDPEGKFVLIDMADGAKRIDTQLEKEVSLAGIYVLASAREYILVTNTPITQADPNTHISPAPGGYFSPLVNGRAYAFDRRTGQSLWPQPVKVDQFGLPLQQASELPVLTFLRQIRKTERGRSTGINTSALCVDKRTGQIVFRNDEISTQTRAFDMLGKPADAEVLLMLPGTTFTLKFSDEAAGAEPAADDSAAKPGTGQEQDAPSAPEKPGEPDGAPSAEPDGEGSVPAAESQSDDAGPPGDESPK